MKAMSYFAAAVLALAGCALAPSARAQGVADAAAVHAVVLQKAAAWNRHDAAAHAAFYTPDCDVVNIVGWWWQGRAEVRQKLARAFSTVFRDSTLAFTEVRVKFLKPDVAVVHARWSMTGARMPPGMPTPGAGIITMVMTQHAGRWRIAEFQNTLSRPEHPFPAASAAVPPGTDPR